MTRVAGVGHLDARNTQLVSDVLEGLNGSGVGLVERHGDFWRQSNGEKEMDSLKKVSIDVIVEWCTAAQRSHG